MNILLLIKDRWWCWMDRH